MTSDLQKTYKKLIVSLFRYMLKEGYTKKPIPKFVINDKPQGNKLKITTGYYDPENMVVTAFTNGRHIKDVMRSIAHELIHHRQNVEGRLKEGSYEGDRIVDDNKLLKLESEAYKDGNLSFRSWTETI